MSVPLDSTSILIARDALTQLKTDGSRLWTCVLADISPLHASECNLISIFKHYWYFSISVTSRFIIWLVPASSNHDLDSEEISYFNYLLISKKKNPS